MFISARKILLGAALTVVAVIGVSTTVNAQLLGGGGGGDEAQVGAEGVADVQEERERRVGVQVAFVALVEHDDVHSRQLLVPLEALQECAVDVPDDLSGLEPHADE